MTPSMREQPLAGRSSVVDLTLLYVWDIFAKFALRRRSIQRPGDFGCASLVEGGRNEGIKVVCSRRRTI